MASLHLVLVILGRVRRVPLEGLLYERRDFRRGGQVRAHRLEAVPVGHVRQRDRLAVAARVAEGALRGHRLVLTAGVLQVTLLLGLDAVAGLVAPFVRAVRKRTLLALADDRYHVFGGSR